MIGPACQWPTTAHGVCPCQLVCTHATAHPVLPATVCHLPSRRPRAPRYPLASSTISPYPPLQVEAKTISSSSCSPPLALPSLSCSAQPSNYALLRSPRRGCRHDRCNSCYRSCIHHAQGVTVMWNSTSSRQRPPMAALCTCATDDHEGLIDNSRLGASSSQVTTSSRTTLLH
jgi:hypothetical protein